MSVVASSRGRRGPAYYLLTPGNRYPSRLAGWADTTVFKLATPRNGGARFGQYLLELAPGGGTRSAVGSGFEHMLYGVDGVSVLDGEPLAAGDYAYVPQGATFTLAAEASAHVLWLKRRYEAVPELAAPGPLRGGIASLETITTPSGLVRRELLPPDDEAFDFNVSLLEFPPGAALGNVEIHDEEHGLYVTEGAGTYLLGTDEHAVEAGDFIYMAPYCPQGFRASASGPAEYLLYKDTWRDGF